MIKKALSAAALVLALTSGAFAQAMPATTETTTTTVQPAAVQQTTVTTTQYGLVAPVAFANDAELMADLAALNNCYMKYDRRILAMLLKTQANEFCNVNEDTNLTWFQTHPLNHAEMHALMAYLQERLHLTPAQEDELWWLEYSMIREAKPLALAYENRLAALIAAQRTAINTVQATTVSTEAAPAPAPVVETPPAPAPAPVQKTTVKVQKKMIRNTDLK